LDGQRLPNGIVPLIDDSKTHEVRVNLADAELLTDG
jgi:hypothetical protein